ncbi:hypothetical protein GOP47_0020378 [Adiantum capillus-veneris]|uniref:Uncharacterized protein n=1 Tax=Adiantum capillus-veneris TaxID=13818 RepID=A0A9D4UCV0_ADICA|nr:hypothetical protein GOP47_0020378 [Adiantum capillus-veneris]
MPHKLIQARKRTEQPETTRLHRGTATRFRFTMGALEDLRASVSLPGQLERCSRNVALVALLWKGFARVRLEVQGLPRSHELDLAVPMNMRTRGLSEGYMGNGLCRLSVPATLQELCDNQLCYVVDKIKRTLEGLDLWESLQSMMDQIELHLRNGLTPYKVGLTMTSLVALPFYDTDCGWGSPTYVGRPSQHLTSSCIIMGHPMAQAWNVLVVFSSLGEHACFQETIAKYIS